MTDFKDTCFVNENFLMCGTPLNVKYIHVHVNTHWCKYSKNNPIVWCRYTGVLMLTKYLTFNVNCFLDWLIG